MSSSFVFSLFPGRVSLTPAEAGAAAFGWTSKTVRNRLLAGTFPLPLVEVGSKKVVPLTALAAALGEDEPVPAAALPAAAPAQRGRGRPRKIAAGR